MRHARAGGRLTEFVGTYTKDLKADDLRRLFTRDAREAYRFFARDIDVAALEGLPWHRRVLSHLRLFVRAFVLKLSPARRVVFALSVFLALMGLVSLMNVGLVRGEVGDVNVRVPGVVLPDGAGSLLVAFGLMNLLVLLEVADRLTLKNDLEIAREIQQAMLPRGLYTAPGLETMGLSRPANTVGGDFYDILPGEDGRVAIAVGDVAGKGSPASLLMALLLAMMRTLLDERLEPADLVSRLNVQVSRHAPGNRFITLFYGVYEPARGELTFVNAGHMPPLVMRAGGGFDRLLDGGMALGMFDQASYQVGRASLQPNDVLAIYSDGITEAENANGVPFDERGLQVALRANARAPIADIGAAVTRAVETHTGDSRLADDLTILLVRRTT
jgi:serine phosphatase RsbU (regulator of sigma subunit)